MKIDKLEVRNEEDRDVINLRGSIVSNSTLGTEGSYITPVDVSKALKDVKSNNVYIVINSSGGDVYASIEIYNMLKGLNKNITTVISGRAFSGAHVIAMAGSERLIYENSQGLAHNSSTVSWGNKEELADVIDFLDKIDDNLITIYMNHFKGNEEELRDLMKKGQAMNADECLEHGFATKIIKDLKDKEEEGDEKDYSNSTSLDGDGVDIEKIVNRVLEVIENSKQEEKEDVSIFKYFKEV